MIAKKLLRIEITEGIDVGLECWLAGETLRIGNDPSADLVLSEPGILTEHIMCRRVKAGWKFEISPAAEVFQNGRLVTSGRLKADDILRLGQNTVLTVKRRSVPADQKDLLKDEPEPSDVPLPVVIAGFILILACMVGYVIYDHAQTPEIKPTDAIARIGILEEHFSDCVYGLDPGDIPENARLIDPAQLYWQAGALIQQEDLTAAKGLASALYAELTNAINRGSLLETSKNLEAAQSAFRQIETLLPSNVEGAPCPIVAQARRDIASLKNRMTEE
ncbi:MAG: FHA domain-containing protein [Hyphomicrobiales bacterium]